MPALWHIKVCLNTNIYSYLRNICESLRQWFSCIGVYYMLLYCGHIFLVQSKLMEEDQL